MAYKIIRDYGNKYQSGDLSEVEVLLDSADDLATFMEEYGPVAPGSKARVMAYGGNEYLVNASGNWYINAAEGDVPIYIQQDFVKDEVKSSLKAKAMTPTADGISVEYEALAGYQIDGVSVTIGGEAYTDYTWADGTLTIAAADLTGKVRINVESSQMCRLTQGDGGADDTYTTTQDNGYVANDEDLTITYSPVTGYQLDGIDVWFNGELQEDGEGYSFDEGSGILSIDKDELLPGMLIDINVGTSAKCEVTQTDGGSDDTYTSTFSGRYVNNGAALTITYAVAAGYQIDGIAVEFNGVAQTAGEGYTYNAETGVLAIAAAKMIPGLAIDITLTTSAVQAAD